MATEKDLYTVGHGNDSGSNDYIHDRKLSKTGAGEAADLYGDIATAEEYGYVERGLKARHIQFIALGGTIGTGLFLGIGSYLAAYGPLSVLLGYSITGAGIFGMMMCLGEMSTWLPLPGAIPQYCARYVEPAMGFAVGWNNWYQCSITLCVEIAAAAIVIGFWNTEINKAAWITIIIVLVVGLNIFAVSVYGEAEFIFASVKLVTIIGLLLVAIVIDLGGSPQGRLGFQYWKNPGAMETVVADGHWGRFLAFFSTLIGAAFSYGGVEMVAVAAGEAEDPRVNIPKAVRRVFWRILFFYVFGSLAIGLTVPSTDKRLGAGDDGRASPWVIMANRASISVLPHIINAVILTSASSSANAFLYTGSRYMFGIAQNGHGPKFLLKCSKGGVPYYCVGITASISLLTYMCATASATDVFWWFANLTTIAQLFTWCSICISYIRFRKGLIYHGVDRNTLVFKSPFQPYTAYMTLCFFAVIIVFNGWQVFTTGKWDIEQFIISYIGVVIYFGLYGSAKIFLKSKIVPISEMDIFSGKAALDAQVWPERIPRNFAEKVWFWIA